MTSDFDKQMQDVNRVLADADEAVRSADRLRTFAASVPDHDPDEDFDDEDDEQEDDDEQDDGYAIPPLVGGRLQVMREKCSTCIFRPGNPMQLNDGRVAGMLREVRARDGFIQCHQTLATGEPGAICRGSSDAHVGQMERIAGRLGAIDLVEPKAEVAS